MFMYRTIEITRIDGVGKYYIHFVEYRRDASNKPCSSQWLRKEHESVKFDRDDPVFDWSEQWIKDGHVPVAAKLARA